MSALEAVRSMRETVLSARPGLAYASAYTALATAWQPSQAEDSDVRKCQ
jgi:hypothetical protein